MNAANNTDCQVHLFFLLQCYCNENVYNLLFILFTVYSEKQYLVTISEHYSLTVFTFSTYDLKQSEAHCLKSDTLLDDVQINIIKLVAVTKYKNKGWVCTVFWDNSTTFIVVLLKLKSNNSWFFWFSW